LSFILNAGTNLTFFNEVGKCRVTFFCRAKKSNPTYLACRGKPACLPFFVFNPNGNCYTCIKLVVFQTVKDLEHDWCYFWENCDYSDFPSIGIETVADKEYRLAELSDQESLNSVLNNFQSIWHNKEEH